MDQEEQYDFLDYLFVRAPFYSTETYALKKLPEILLRQDFRNALWLASPAFYRLVEQAAFKWDALGKKEQLTLRKYYNRMSHRATPFGAFSSFSLVSWDSRDRVRLAEPNRSVLHLLPSREWQVNLQEQLKNTDMDYKARVNPTLMRLGDSLSFIRSTIDEAGKMQFLINRIAAEELNLELIKWASHDIITISQFRGKVRELSGCTAEEAHDYVSFLLQEQVLVSEYEGSLIGSGLSGEDSRWYPLKDAVFSSDLDLPAIGEAPARARDRKSSFDGNALYGGLERPVQEGGISAEWQEEILAVTGLLRRIVIPYPTPALRNFMKTFRDRFADQKVSLLEATDPDRGISYADLHSSAVESDLLKDIRFPEQRSATKSIDWTPVHRLFLRLWLRNTERSLFEPICISAKAASDLAPPEAPVKMPPSIAFLFSRYAGGLVVENNGGASATSLIGRFGLFSQDVEALCRTIAAQEASANPGVVFAELHQLSDTHADNINRRQPVYDHVIPINTFSPDAAQSNVELRDLQLYVEGEELILERISDGKRVIPRLPTAYNHQHNRLAIYQLLCDLQYQGLQVNFTFDLEKLFPAMDFYPRVTFRRTILCLAKWRVSEAEIVSLTAADTSLGRLHDWRHRRVLPPFVVMGLSDQQLAFDLTDDQQALFFLTFLKEFKTVTVREYLEPDHALKAGKNKLAGQFIAILVKKIPVYRHEQGMHPVTGPVQRRFLPGSSCLYLKIYSNPEVADSILLNIIRPFLEASQVIVRSWFFIRYHDPDAHIRLRVFTHPQNDGLLVNGLYQALTDSPEAVAVHEFKQDTYERELERYSSEMIERVEGIFSIGSFLALTWLSEKGSPHDPLFDSSVFGLVYRMALRFFSDPLQLVPFFKQRADAFIREFGDRKDFRYDLDRKYRALSGVIEPVMPGEPEANNAFLQNVVTTAFLEKIGAAAHDTIAWPESRRVALIADLIHMQVNRMFSRMQRQHEALIYYCLLKKTDTMSKRKSAQ